MLPLSTLQVPQADRAFARVPCTFAAFFLFIAGKLMQAVRAPAGAGVRLRHHRVRGFLFVCALYVCAACTFARITPLAVLLQADFEYCLGYLHNSKSVVGIDFV